MSDELPESVVAGMSDRDLLVSTWTTVRNINEDVRDHEGRIRVLEKDYITLNERPHITPKQLWLGVLGVLGSGGGIVALLNFLLHR